MGSAVNVGVLLVLVLSSSFLANAKPFQQNFMDPVDFCIVNCDYCYKGDVLLKCANECIFTDGVLGSAWHQTCPFFNAPIYFN